MFEKLGIQYFEIPYHEWDKLKKGDQQHKYLAKLLPKK